MKKIVVSTFSISLEENEKKIYINSKININNCTVKIYELSSNLIIYSNIFDFNSETNYWIQIGPTFDLLKGLKISIFYDKNIIYEEKIKLNKNVDYSFLDIEYSDYEENCWAPFWEIFIKKTYEYKNIKVNKGDVVVDLGANIGFFSIYSIINGASKVYSVEASTTTYNFLINNIKKYNIETLNAAISDGVTKDFYISERSGSSSIYNKSKNVETVNCITFDSFINKYNIEHINFLKIDIEGSEYELFNSIDPNFLVNNIDNIFLEFHLIDGYALDNIINKLVDNNFDYFITEDNGNVGMMLAINNNKRKKN